MTPSWLQVRNSCSSRHDGLQKRRQLATKHCLGQNDTHSGVGGGVLLEKESVEAALHWARGIKDQSLVLLSDVAFGLPIRGGVIGSRCNSLDTIPLIECSDLIGHECCAIV